VQVADRKEADDVIALVRAIEPSGRAGIELPLLIARTGIPPKRVERLLKRHSDYFVRIADEPKYTLNRFREFRGSPELIIADVESSHRRMTRRQIVAPVLLLLSMLLVLSTRILD
jgi:hypothetical protein